jgi:4-amino-4-deoxy-L-arabinose transferase-like glycosyltransferase
MALFGQTASGIHLGLLLVKSATILLVYVLGKRFFGTVPALVAAAT